MEIERRTGSSTQNPSEPTRKDINRKGKEQKESDNPIKKEQKENPKK